MDIFTSNVRPVTVWRCTLMKPTEPKKQQWESTEYSKSKCMCSAHCAHIFHICKCIYMLQNHIFAPMVTCSVQSCGMTCVRGGASADFTSWLMHFSWLQPKHLLPHGNKYFRAELFVSSRFQLEEYRLWICRIWRGVRLRIRASVIAVLAQVGNPVRCL